VQNISVFVLRNTYLNKYFKDAKKRLNIQEIPASKSFPELRDGQRLSDSEDQ
jgi:hypothetical protein